MANTIGNLAVILGLDTTKFMAGMNLTKREMRQVQREAAKTARETQQAFQAAGVAMLAFAGAATAAAGLAVKSALDEEIGIRQLDAAMKAVGESYAAQKAAIESVIAAQMHKTNFSDEAQRAALQKLIAISGDYSASLSALPAVINLAAGANMDLESAALLVGKALAGETGTLARYGIQIGENATKQEIINKLMLQFAGAAEASANPMTQLKNELDEVAQVFGKALLPFVKSATETLKDLTRQFTDMSPQAQDMAFKLGLGATAFAGLTGASLLFIAQVPGIVAGFAAIKVAATGLLLPLGYASALLAAFAAPGSESVDVLEHLKKAQDNVTISLEKGSKALRAANEDVADYAKNVTKALDAAAFKGPTQAELDATGSSFRETAEALKELGKQSAEDALRKTREGILATKQSLVDELAVLRDLMDQNMATNDQIQQAAWLQGLLEPATRAATSAMNDQKDAVDRMRSATERLNDEVAKNIQMAVAQAGATMTGRISGAEVESEALDATRRAELQALIAKGQRGEISNEALGQAIASLNARTKQSRASLATGVAISSGQVRAAAEGVTLMSPQALAAISKAAALQAQFGGLPKMARGGRVTEGGMAIVGENGPEPVYLPKGAQVQPNGAGARTITITSNVNVQGLTIEGAAEKIARAVQQNLGRANYEASLRPAGP